MKKAFLTLTVPCMLVTIHTLDMYCSDNNNKLIITKPYTPSFTARHPYLTTAAVTSVTIGLVGTCIGLASHPVFSFESYISTVVSGIFIGKLYNNLSKASFLDSLLINQIDALRTVFKAHIGFRVESKETSSDSPEKYQQLIQKFAQECPICLLEECVGTCNRLQFFGEQCCSFALGGGLVDCPLSRTANPQYRAAFEKEVVSEIVSKIDQKREICYISFGCGGAFQDLVIMAKVLAQKPDATINIFLIDTKFNNSSNNSSSAYNNRTYTDTFRNQFDTFLKNTFPEATLAVSLYDSGCSYMNTKNCKLSDTAVVLTAADIDDSAAFLTGAPQKYIKLCVSLLEKNSHTYNLLLAQNRDKTNKPKPALATISLKPGRDYEQYKFGTRVGGIYMRTKLLDSKN